MDGDECSKSLLDGLGTQTPNYEYATESWRPVKYIKIHPSFVSEEEDVAWKVHRFRKNRARGPSELRAEKLQSLLGVATRAEYPDPTH